MVSNQIQYGNRLNIHKQIVYTTCIRRDQTIKLCVTFLKPQLPLSIDLG